MQDIRIYLKDKFERLEDYYRRNPGTNPVETNFGNGVGDYDRGVHTLYVYLLKYALAYGCEFYFLYDAILRDMNNNGKLSVTSIGAGTGLDYWALTLAIERLNFQKKLVPNTVSYTGIEPEDAWETLRFDTRENDKVCFPDNLKDFNQLLDKLESNENEVLDDIYIFPKSILEVCYHSALQPDGQCNYEWPMVRFASIISQRISDKPVYLAFSYPSWNTNNGGGEGPRYATKLIEALIAQGLRWDYVNCDEQYCESFDWDPNNSPRRSDLCTVMVAKETNIRNYGLTYFWPVGGALNIASVIIPENKMDIWKNKYCNELPMTTTNYMGIQIFKVYR